MIRWLVQKYDGRRVNLRSVPLAKIGIATPPAWPQAEAIREINCLITGPLLRMFHLCHTQGL